ncbi:FmdE family protein [Maridesulfovibrio salexigens]|uniref:Formylmethanofuran dehydrogenase subunit E region n=1 Tax=Maridesulfovibrio salexigens (strain ATCC 14822 / DSM 2638 / NCIMB 8403 / VKM B-1763) TaxID=526222 RepID=C6BYW3_MARSD|nr:FmdE family protein [Maridesulfovibrio salexigens]ACS80720.1 formylmethanofuran dehydrogenase subunit E region [Maridesulfovibrio salexigens DSM 2638]
MNLEASICQENTPVRDDSIGPYTYDEFIEAARRFHGSPAPGLILGGYMMEEARKHLPEGTLFDAISETSWCLPDAVQMLTLCSTGNGWLRVKNLGVYALSLYDKYTGEGVRIRVDPEKLKDWPETESWFFKRRPKHEQDSVKLHAEIRQAGASFCSIEAVQIKPEAMIKRSKGGITTCPICGDAYPGSFGAICRSCQGESPYASRDAGLKASTAKLPEGLKVVPVDEAEGKTAVHDMTRIVPGESKGPEFRKDHDFTAHDICRLQMIGKNHIYVDEGDIPEGEWVHENEAARTFGRIMAGDGICPDGEPKEGKVTLLAEHDGILVSDLEMMNRFNLVPDVMVAARKSGTLVKEGTRIAGTRAIPLYLSRENFSRAVSALNGDPLFKVLPLQRKKVGILITGDEVFNGLIDDKFESVITAKVQALGCEVVRSVIKPDNREEIRDAALFLMKEGCDLLITTAGMSVDPDDVTRHGLVDAGVSDLLYGAPVLPGTMLLLAKAGKARVIGVPACALFFKTTSLDLVLPKVIAGQDITRSDLAALADGGYCMECKVCTFPKCPFGK